MSSTKHVIKNLVHVHKSFRSLNTMTVSFSQLKSYFIAFYFTFYLISGAKAPPQYSFLFIYVKNVLSFKVRRLMNIH